MCANDLGAGGRCANVLRWIEKARALHGDAYDYDLVTDEDYQSGKVTIVCREHGPFRQSKGQHSTKRKRKASATALYAMIQAQEYRCALSGMKVTPDTARIDHKIPVSSGGGDEIENLQWVHQEINRMKGSLDNDEFIDLCRKVAQWAS